MTNASGSEALLYLQESRKDYFPMVWQDGLQHFFYLRREFGFPEGKMKESLGEELKSEKFSCDIRQKEKLSRLLTWQSFKGLQVGKTSHFIFLHPTYLTGCPKGVFSTLIWMTENLHRHI